MVVDYDSISLANTIGKNIQTAGNLNQTVFDSENVSSLNIVGINSVQLQTTVLFIKHLLGSTSFQLDHSIYSRLDRSVLKLTGTYTGSSSIITSTVN
jgi:hypothetical protein